MLGAANEIFNVLVLLLPGFVAAVIYYSLTSNPKPSPFERVIQALVFTAIIQVVVALLPDWFPSHEVDIGAEALWDPVGPAVIAVVVALAVVIMVNYDLAHGLLRRLGVTRETSYASEWYSAFNQHRGLPVVLHLVGERRLYGWAEEWPGHPGEGHFRIVEGEWFDSEEESSAGTADASSLEEEGAQEGDEAVVVGTLIPFAEVEMVEFVSRKADEESREGSWFKRRRQSLRERVSRPRRRPRPPSDNRSTEHGQTRQ